MSAYLILIFRLILSGLIFFIGFSLYPFGWLNKLFYLIKNPLIYPKNWTFCYLANEVIYICSIYRVIFYTLVIVLLNLAE